MLRVSSASIKLPRYNYKHNPNSQHRVIRLASLIPHLLDCYRSTPGLYLGTHLPGLEFDGDDMSHALVQQLDGHPEVGHCCEREVLLRRTRKKASLIRSQSAAGTR